MQTRSPRILALLACGVAISFILFRVFAAEPQYELAQATSVDVGGQPVQLAAGSVVAPMGSLTPDSSGNIMVKLTLPNGSVTIAQIPAAIIRVKGAAETGAAGSTGAPVAAAPEAAGGVPPPAASSSGLSASGAPPASAPMIAASTPAPATPAPAASTPAPASTPSSAPATGGNDAAAKYNVEGGGGNQPEHKDWKLVWEDDFSKDDGKIDPKKWTFKIDGKGNGNEELQYYSDDPKNAHIENGQLVITGIKEKMKWANYTSAKLWTKGNFEFQYGRAEACIKVPKAQAGDWPAFWMMPHEPSPYGGWPNCGEIDIMEVINKEDKLYGTNHFGKEPKQGGSQVTLPPDNSVNPPRAIAFDQDFHIYGVEWEPKVFRWYLDHKCYGSLEKWGSNGAPFPAPFDQKFYIILNYAVGGQWPKAPDASSTYPQSMFVKYVRVYQPQ